MTSPTSDTLHRRLLLGVSESIGKLVAYYCTEEHMTNMEAINFAFKMVDKLRENVEESIASDNDST